MDRSWPVGGRRVVDPTGTQGVHLDDRTTHGPRSPFRIRWSVATCPAWRRNRMPRSLRTLALVIAAAFLASAFAQTNLTFWSWRTEDGAAYEQFLAGFRE